MNLCYRRIVISAFSLRSAFLLSSCVYYGTSHKIGNDRQSPCSSGSAKQNKECRGELDKLNESIDKQMQRQFL
jgi:hypothetical protein